MAADACSATEPEGARIPLPSPGRAASPGAGERGIEERDFSFDGFRYRCRLVHQSAPRTEPVLILGGSSQDLYSWLRYEKRLGPLATVITVDLPGYGSADFLPAKYGIDFLAATVRHLLAELAIPRINLVAVCYGGAIGLRFLQHYPELVERLALVGMTARIPDDYTEAMERWAGMIERGDTAPIARELTDRFMSPPGTGPVRRHAAVARLVYQQIAGQNAEQMRMSAEHNTRLMRHEWYRPEPITALPSVVVTGEYDTLCTPVMGRQMASQLADARFLTITESDHLAPVERPDDLADLLARFCTGQSIDELPYTNPVERLGTLLRPELLHS
ncbi:pimeloyl-ACP methyl ester carboxylesterase [Kitasatospora sp. MAA4]|uniref:alpha/beta fold hydrolase n=1 Tax=Kitasatospora sp. MAA4 TaxID=3035093 RepID=UPI0024757530|nr:alpha/beta hydrolase [Kitasatospora sp. MAA4]MDH6134443.1 pimeloyl-ACP methyl ester carboxylesterase [Kitasatospora sp. MAA4]